MGLGILWLQFFSGYLIVIPFPTPRKEKTIVLALDLCPEYISGAAFKELLLKRLCHLQ